MFRINREHRQDVLRGLHSGIPICCITFYVTTYRPRFDSGFSGDAKDWQYTRRHFRRIRRIRGRKQPTYIPCPACIRLNRIVPVHECTARCAGQLGAETQFSTTKGK